MNTASILSTPLTITTKFYRQTIVEQETVSDKRNSYKQGYTDILKPTKFTDTLRKTPSQLYTMDNDIDNSYHLVIDMFIITQQSTIHKTSNRK